MLEERKPHVAIIDYGMGNLFSVKQACEHVGLKTVITSEGKDIRDSAAVILPGVGAFGDAMANLIRLNLVELLRDVITNGKPSMAICLGMQLLMTESEEFGKHKGLDVFGGTVVSFPNRGKQNETIKVPQVGWNQIHSDNGGADRWDKTVLRGLDEGEFMYFVHSFYVVPEDASISLSHSSYEGVTYCSSLAYKNIFACQFHPERSAEKGISIYKNFARLINENEI
jgi:glutamine amidotransferase